MTPLQKDFIIDCLWDKYEKCDRLSDVKSLAEFCAELDLEDLGEVFIKTYKLDFAKWKEEFELKMNEGRPNTTDWGDWFDEQSKNFLFI